MTSAKPTVANKYQRARELSGCAPGCARCGGHRGRGVSGVAAGASAAALRRPRAGDLSLAVR